MRGTRVRDTRVAEGPARGELVVRGHECAGPVQHPDAGALESRQLPEAGLDPVQPLGDIEAADGNVSFAERAAADAGSRMRRPGRARVSARFVLVRWWATIATCMGP